MIINYAYAADAVDLVSAINTVIINPLIAFIFAVALVYFFIGLIQFLFKRGSDENSVQQGKSHMLWGIVGMFIMVSVFGIMQLLINSIGAEVRLDQVEQGDSVN